MTTPDQIPGQPAATRHRRGAALLCACLFAVPALPALAMKPVVPAAAHPALPAATPGAPVGTPAAPFTLQTAPDQPMQMSGRALLLASDINRLIGDPAPKATAADDAAASKTDGIQSVLQRALTLLGTPYRWGGTTTRGFDCSGLVGYVFRTTLGIELPRVSRDMARSGEKVDRASLVPGDLVFFGRRGRVNHVGIYLGEGRFVHAPRTGREVTVSKLDGYWGRKFLEARRVAGI